MPLEEFIITVFCWVKTVFKDVTAGIKGMLGLTNALEPKIDLVGIQQVFQQRTHHYCDKTSFDTAFQDFAKYEKTLDQPKIVILYNMF